MSEEEKAIKTLVCFCRNQECSNCIYYTPNRCKINNPSNWDI